jgi:HD-GYP domain-containing protein (c-di-GMP phosphodiesterase class II)
MNRHPHIRLSNVILGLSSALDLVNWFLVNHHRQVTSLAVRIAAEIGMSDEDRSNLAIAAALHDIGAISFNERFSLSFDADEGVMKHAELGYHLLSGFKPFMRAAEVVRYHHLSWDKGRGAEYGGCRVPVGSHILHLADRAAVLIRGDEMVLKRAKFIRDAIRQEANKKFVPELVDVFQRLAERESFWLDAVHTASDFSLNGCTAFWNIDLDMSLLRNLSDLFRMIIDFRTPHTATHSNDVAHLSAAIARLFGFSEHEAETLHIAGNLHDLGKLAVPVEVIEKTGPLSEDETFVMRSHSFHTYRVLKKIGGLDEINIAASLHHECLDGTGYPFRSTESMIPFAARIVAVADVLAALTENRSYREAMGYGGALQVLHSMAKARKLDGQIVALVDRYQDELLDVRNAAGDEGLREFRKLRNDADENRTYTR